MTISMLDVGLPHLAHGHGQGHGHNYLNHNHSPGSDISPKTEVPPKSTNKSEYFPTQPGGIPASPPDSIKLDTTELDSSNPARRPSSVSVPAESPISISAESDNALGRKMSTSSVTFQPPRNKSLPQGTKKQTDRSRIRASSPPPKRFQHHVAFDNVPNGEATKHNTTSLTLNVRHRGYQARRRSRTFMVGVDEHAYSDYATQWLLDELVDDGDEIVCVRVIEKEIRFNDRQYQEDARQVMDGILAKNGANRAISFILEYAVGKLHATFQKLIQMYQPAMLIVGTRGRSLGGIQGLVNTRNSFSKYCLQYSPVPVVVVRPTEKRIKKKVKRTNDTTRQTYLSMLAATHGRHEADSEASSTYELEVQISPDEEAHQVAKVLGLPAAFDPTIIKPIQTTPQVEPERSPAPSTPQTSEEAIEDQRLIADASPGSGGAESDDDEDDDAEFEVMSGTQALVQQEKLDQLHKMEAGEAAALRMGVDDEDEEEDDEAQNSKPAS